MKTFSTYGVSLTSLQAMMFSKWQENSGLPAPNTISLVERKKRVENWLTDHEMQKKSNPLTITEGEYSEVYKDYKGIYSSDDIHGTNFDGRRTLLTWIEGEGTVLLIEGSGLKIVKTDAENINPARKKRN